MSIKSFCDVCEKEIQRNVVGDRVNGEQIMRRNGNHTIVNIEIICGIGKGHWNNGDLCKSCLFDALDREDPRPRIESA